MGSNSSSGGSGNKNSANNVPPSKRKYDVSGTLSDPREKDDTAAKMSLFREQGATDLKNTKFYTPTTAILAGVGQDTSRYNRDYFANEVLGKGAYKETTKQDFEKMSRTSQESLYSGYMSGRQSGKTDAYGNPVSQGDNGGATSSGMVVQAPTVTSPTEAEVSQSAATDATGMDSASKKIKRKGRSATILTSSAGVEGDATLGKKSLLGE